MRTDKLAAGEGLAWFGAGWRMFMASPLIWLAITVIYAVLVIVLSLIPVLGSIASTILHPLFYAGFLAGCRAVEAGEPLRVEHFFSAFTDARARTPLAVLGVLLLAATAAVLFVFLLLAGGSALTAAGLGEAGGGAVFAGGALLGLLVVLVLLAVITMAFVYAPPLVMFAGRPTTEAIRESFQACLTQILPLTVAGLVLLVLSLLASLPLLLGWLVLIPVIAGAVWASYRAIFEPAPVAEPPPAAA